MCSKGGRMLVFVFKKLKFSKNVKNQNHAPKLIFFNENKIEKDSDNF